MLAVSGCLQSEELVREWLQIATDCRDNNCQLVAKDGLNQLFDITGTDVESLVNQDLRITIFKGVDHGTFRFFSIKGYLNGLTDPDVERGAREILIAAEFEPFWSSACGFASWNNQDAPLTQYAPPGAEDIDARKLVRDATNCNLPSRVSFWLPDREPICSSDIYEAWQHEAVKRLAALPAAEIWPDEDGAKIVISGPRKRTVSFNPEAISAPTLFLPLMTALRWVCELKREAEVRHTLLVKRVATEWPSDDPPWSTGLSRALGVALEGAKADYKAHLHETTKDTLKAMADLRKALNDEATKVVEYTKGLTSSLVRDLAIGLGAVGFRMLTAAADGKDTYVSEALLIAVAVWFGLSYWLTVSSNKRFLIVQARMRASWHRRIHAVLASRDFTALVRAPLKEAIKAYGAVRRQVGWCYLGGAIALVALALWLPMRSLSLSKPPTAVGGSSIPSHTQPLVAPKSPNAAPTNSSPPQAPQSAPAPVPEKTAPQVVR